MPGKRSWQVLRCTTFPRFGRTTANRRTVGGRKSPCRHFFVALAARAAARFSAPTGIRPGSSPFSRAHRSRTSPEGPGFSPCKRATLRPGRARTSISAHQVPQPGLAPSWPGITGPDRAVPVWQSTPPGLAEPVPGYRGSVHRNTGVASGRAHRLVFRRVRGHTINRII